jgi:AraC-like DNA-binding protein
VPDVVTQVSISKSVLAKRFKASTGKTIKEEINHLRVICAQRLLLDEKVIIKDVHKQSGFGSTQNMRRIFVKTIGMSPSEYLKTLD